jgi:6-pyruvoyl-tetrahydropterin synthase
MATELWTTITVEVAHTLREGLGVPRLHGHSYWLQFFVSSPAASPVPLPVLKDCAGAVYLALDHRDLDDIIAEPTMESIAEYAASIWRGPALTRIVVRRDSIGCGVEWRP